MTATYQATPADTAAPARVVRYSNAVSFYAQPASGAVKVAQLHNGRQGLQQLTDDIQAAVEAGLKKPMAWQFAREIVEHVKPGDTYGEVKAIFDYLAGGDIPYRLDAIGNQIVPSFEQACASRGVDCKGKTVLAAVLVGSLGNDVRIVTVDQHVGKSGPSNHHHVYSEWFTPSGEWEPIDPVLALARKNPQPGQELPFKSKIIHGRPA
jgi:hypothetical protein